MRGARVVSSEKGPQREAPHPPAVLPIHARRAAVFPLLGRHARVARMVRGLTRTWYEVVWLALTSTVISDASGSMDERKMNLA